MNIHIKNLTLNFSGEADSEKIDLIIQKLDLIMGKQETFNEIQNSLNETTNKMAAVVTNIKEDYQKLLKEVQDGSVSDESLAAHKTNVDKLATIATALEETAATVENPLPTTPIPEPIPEEGNQG